MIDIRLSLKRLKKQIKYNKFACLLLLFSSVLCILFFTSLFVRYMPHFNDKRKNNSKYRFYSLIFSRKLEYEELKSLQEKLPELDSFRITNVNESQIISDENNIETYFTTFLSDTDFVNDIELKNADIDKISDLSNNEVLIPISNKLESVHNNIKVKGINLKIIGKWEGADNLINFDTFLKISDINQIIFRTKNVLNSTEINDLYSFLSNYPIRSITSPIDAYEKDSSMTTTVILIINIIYVLSIISYASIFWVLIKFLEKELRVYRIIGMTKRRIFLGMLLDIFSFISFCTLISFIIHELLWDTFFSKANNYSAHNIGLSDYFFIFVLIMILSFIIISPYIYKSLNHIISKKKVKD